MRIFGSGPDLRELAELGIDSLWGGLDTDRIAASRAAGLAYDLACGAFSTSEVQYRAVTVDGQPVWWFGSGCPNKAELRKSRLKQVAELARTPGVRSVIIDGARFASPASPEGDAAFFTCFCPDCQAKARQLGIDGPRMRTAVAALHAAVYHQGELRLDDCREGLGDWLRFRTACITEFLQDFHQTVKAVNPQLRTGIFIFAPTLAPLVGQDYRALSFLDTFIPMLYRHYRHPTGPACLDHEYRAIGRLINQAAAPARLALRELAQSIGLQFPEDESGIFPPAAIEKETAQARNMIKDRELCPVILLDDDCLAESIAAARRGGADDVGFFAYAPEHLHALRAARELASMARQPGSPGMNR